MELRLTEQQCGFQRPLLDRRQLGQEVAGDVAEEVAQPNEREPGLGLRGSRGKDSVTAGGRCFDAGEPQGRLPDPCLARKHGDHWKLFGRVEEPDDRFELLFPADKVPAHERRVLSGLDYWATSTTSRITSITNCGSSSSTA